MDSAEKKESGMRCSMELMRCECSLIYEYDMSQVCIGYQIRSFVMVGVRLLCDNDGCDIMGVTLGCCQVKSKEIAWLRIFVMAGQYLRFCAGFLLRDLYFAP
jgi:hypothetical protein